MPHEPGGARLAARASISVKTIRHTDTVKGQKKKQILWEHHSSFIPETKAENLRGLQENHPS